jgi:acyl-CoA reductase-like NAD-dependent aldehyde dehydrogenase
MEAKAGEQFSTARHWIDGEWIEGLERAQSINPASGEVIGTYTEAGAPEAQRAVAVASGVGRLNGVTSPPKMSA